MPVARVRGPGRDDAPIVGAAAGRQGQTRELIGLGYRGGSPDTRAGVDPQRPGSVAWREGGFRGIGVVGRDGVPDALGIGVRAASGQRRRRAAGSLDSSRDGLDVLFPGLVIKVFDAPFCSYASRVSPGLACLWSLFLSGPCLSWIVGSCRVAPIDLLLLRAHSAVSSCIVISIHPAPSIHHRPDTDSVSPPPGTRGAARRDRRRASRGIT